MNRNRENREQSMYAYWAVNPGKGNHILKYRLCSQTDCIQTQSHQSLAVSPWGIHLSQPQLPHLYDNNIHFPEFVWFREDKQRAYRLVHSKCFNGVYYWYYCYIYFYIPILTVRKNYQHLHFYLSLFLC